MDLGWVARDRTLNLRIKSVSRHGRTSISFAMPVTAHRWTRTTSASPSSVSRRGLDSARRCVFTTFSHGVASQWARKGVHPFMVSKLMGHSSVSFTLDTYMDEWAEAHDDARLALGEMTGRG